MKCYNSDSKLHHDLILLLKHKAVEKALFRERCGLWLWYAMAKLLKSDPVGVITGTTVPVVQEHAEKRVGIKSKTFNL